MPTHEPYIGTNRLHLPKLHDAEFCPKPVARKHPAPNTDVALPRFCNHHDREVLLMLKLPPPVWALIYVLVAAAISWQLGWPQMPGFPLPKLGAALTLIPWILPVWAALIF